MDTITGEAEALDSQWLAAAQNGDQAAFARLYNAHARAVYWSARRAVVTDDEAQEVTQQVFILAWERRARINVVGQSVLPWLLVATRNISSNRRRQHARERAHHHDDPELGEHPGQYDPTQEAINRLLGEAIDAAVSELSETDQTLYYLCIDEGLSYRDAAETLGSSIGGVRNRLSRLRRTLQTRLATQKEGLL